MEIEAALFWVIMALMLVVFAVFPSVADFCARLLGIYATTNFLFLFMIFLLIVKLFSMTVRYFPAGKPPEGVDTEDGS